MKKTTIIKCLFFISACILGFLGGYLGGYIFKDLLSVNNLNIFRLSFIFLIIYYLSIAIHELTHFIVFKINKVNMRGLLIGPLIFIKKNDKWTFKFKFTKVFFTGGIAIPDINIINNEKDFTSFQHAFSKTLISAPVINIIFTIFFTLLTFIITISLNNPVVDEYMFICLIILCFTTLFITISSMIKNEVVIGDYQAYFATKKDKSFVLSQLYQYILFSTNYTTMDSKKYLIDNLDEYLQSAYDNKLIDLYILSSVDNILYDYLTDKIDYLPQGAKNYIDFAIDNVDIVYDKLPQKEVPSIFLHHIILYLASEKYNKSQIIEFHSNITKKIKVNSHVLKYYDLRTNHLLGLQNNFDFISDKKNIKVSSLYELLSLFDNYYEDEYSLYSKIHNLQKG